MNSVMDDNKILTLTNGARIAMPEQVTLLFETGDMAVASPATVSRTYLHNIDLVVFFFNNLFPFFVDRLWYCVL